MTTTTRPTPTDTRTVVEPVAGDATQPVPATEGEALASVEAAEPVGLPARRGVVRGFLSALAPPRQLAGEPARLGRDTVQILRGTDEIPPAPRDKRFGD